MKSTRFKRGQVWLWVDPIYGDKSNNRQVAIGESGLRYNRYVIIAQVTDSILNQGIIAIPCSSTNNTPNDVKIPLAHVFHDNYTYAKTRSIFSVHPKYLQHYVCTLPEEVMRQLEAELIKLLIPSVTGNMDADAISRYFGIDMSQNKIEYQERPDTTALVRAWIKECVTITGDDSVIKPRVLKSAFDNYCIINKTPVVEDIIEFIDSFTYAINGSTYDFSNRFNYDLLEFKGIALQEKKLEIKAQQKDLIDPKDPQRPGRWTDETIAEFLTCYITEGPTKAAAKFDLKPSTANHYWYKWKSQLEPYRQAESSDTEPVKNESSDGPKKFCNPNDTIPTTCEVQHSISKVSNLIKQSLEKSEILRCMNDVCHASGKNKGNPMTSEEFYEKIGIAIYFSLLDFLGIVRHEKDGRFFVPKINHETAYLETWRFFDKAYHDKRISMEKDGEKMMELYREYYGANKGIDPKWLTVLKTRISNRFIIKDDELDFLVEYIGSNFCETINPATASKSTSTQQTECPDLPKVIQMIQQMKSEGKLKVAKSIEEFNPTEHDALIHGDCLYVKTLVVSNFYNLPVKSFEFRQIINEVKQKGFLKTYKDSGYTVNLAGIKRMQFYAFYFKRH